MVSTERGHASLVGATLGVYEVLGLVGRGAMATVYLARDTSLNRNVALKVLLGSLARNQAVVRRFHQEAQATAPLRHPNIVRIYAAGIEEGTPYIAMEYVEGEPLDRFLRRKVSVKWPNALHIAYQVAQALQCAHERGIVHRDVKPANIMLDHSGRVRLTDFGIANVQTAGHLDSEGGGLIGTPQYMSPELCDNKEATPASDLFSLGVTLHQMIAGQLPYTGDSAMALVKSISNDDAPRLNKLVPDVPDDVARLVAHLLEKQPGSRPESCRAVCETIVHLQESEGGESALPTALAEFIREQAEPRPLRLLTPPPQKRSKTRHPVSGRTRPRVWRRPRVLLSAALVAVVAAFVIGVFVLRTAPQPRMEDAPNLDAVAFSLGREGEVLAQFAAPGFGFAEVTWVGEKPVAVVRARGLDGTLTQEASGLLAIDPSTRTALSLQPPSGPLMDGASPRAWLPHANVLWTPPLPDEATLRESVFLGLCDGPAHRGAQEVVVVAQKWNEALPRPTPLYRTRADAWRPGVAGLPGAHAAGHAVPGPDGFTLCLVLYDRAWGSNYLVERDSRWRPAGRVGRRLTTAGADILPDSVQYSHDGSRIAYIRDSGPSDRELWVVASDGSETNGVPLAIGALGDTYAFSPDGRRIALNIESGGDGDPEIVLIDSRDGRILERLGYGRLSEDAWHRSDYLVVAGHGTTAATGQDEEARQLWAVSVQSPYDRTPITAVEQGVLEECAVSGDGAWAVAVARRANRPSLVFVDLASVSVKLHT